MQADSSQPSTADIRQFLIEAFNDDELTALCSDYFRDVVNDFASGMTKGQKIQLLIGYCQRRDVIPSLLAAIQRARPEQYEKRFPRAPRLPARPEPPKHERDPKQIFISHAHEDAAFAHRLAGDLKKNGWCAWIAPENIRPGEKWVEAINRGLDESGVFLLVLTPRAVQSTWVKDETNVAIEYQHEGCLRFIPLEVERCTAPPLWRAYQRTSFLGRYQDGLDRLLTELGAADAFSTADKRIPPSPPPARPQAPAEPTSTPQPARPPSAYPLKNPLPLLLAGAGVVILAVVAVLISRIPAAMPVPPASRPTVSPTVAATLVLPTKLPEPTRPPPTTQPTPTPIIVVTRVSEKDGMVMVHVPVGEFLMGSADSDKDAQSDEKPQHTVYLDAFWIDRTEVTNAQYKKCVQAGACKASGFASDSKYNADNQPVVGVSWDAAQAYCQWAGRQLPTEVQWEKAARGAQADGRIYPWGNQPTTCEYAVMNDGSGNGCGKGDAPWPVGSKPQGASPYGALDMAGNVWEWVADWYDEKYYASSPPKNPPGPSSGQDRVLRGGSWYNGQAGARAASRGRNSPGDRYNNVGFRCVGVGPGG
jgi:formylglycine-generating enzyme required for sulfatase activity